MVFKAQDTETSEQVSLKVLPTDRVSDPTILLSTTPQNNSSDLPHVERFKFFEKERIWGLFRTGVVTPLPFDPAIPQSLRVIALGAASYPYEFGELPVRLRDRVGGLLDTTRVAQLIQHEGKLKEPMLLGLLG